MTPMSDRSVFVCSINGRIYKAQADGPVTSILTYPIPDLARDFVRPDGGDWSDYPQHPFVNWAHECPIGRGHVEIKSLRYDGAVTRVAVGETKFAQCAADLEGIDLRRRDPRTHRSWNKQAPYTVDECLETAEQAHRLVDLGVATGVSIEFDVDPARKGIDFWDLPHKSTLENRPARHFHNWRGIGYAHARQPVNPGCQTVLKDAPEAVEKAIKIGQTGKLPGGTPLHPIIAKSFDVFRNLPRSSSVTVPAMPTERPVHVRGYGNDSMNDTTGSSSGGNDDTWNDQQSSNQPSNDQPTPGCRALYNAMQGLVDVAASLMSDLKQSDDTSLRKFGKSFSKKLKDMAGDLKARCEKHKARVMADDDVEDIQPSEKGAFDEDNEMDPELKAIEIDDNGAVIIKAFPEWKPRRYKLSDLAPITNVQPTAPRQSTPAPNLPPQKGVSATDDPEYQKALKEYNDIQKKLKKALQEVKPYLEAAEANGKL